MSNTYIFKVRTYNIDFEEEVIDRGYLIADSYHSACAQLLEYYGEENLITMEVEYLSDHSLVFIPSYVNMKQINKINMEM